MPNLNPEPELNQMQEIICATHGGTGGRIAIVRMEEGRVTDTVLCAGPELAAWKARDLNSKPGGNVYFQISTIREGATRRTANDLHDTAVVGLDIDGGHDKGDQAVEMIRLLGGPQPSIVGRTSDEGTQMVWLLDGFRGLAHLASQKSRRGLEFLIRWGRASISVSSPKSPVQKSSSVTFGVQVPRFAGTVTSNGCRSPAEMADFSASFRRVSPCKTGREWTVSRVLSGDTLPRSPGGPFV